MCERIDKSKSLGFRQIGISFAILVLLGIGCLCLTWMFDRVGYAPAIWVILSMTTFAGSWVLARNERLKKKKWLKDVAEFGEKLWYFPNLWYVVLLVGLYVTAMDVAERVIEKPPTLFDVSIVLIAARNVVLAAFLAVITSVLAHTFWELSESTVKINKALSQLGTMTDKVKGLGLKVSGTIDTLAAIAQLSEYSAFVCELTRAAKEIASSNTDLGRFRDAITELSKSIISYNKTALLPLFPPEVDTSSEDKNIFPNFIKSMQSNEKHQQHCAYMAVAEGRYLEAEAQERSFPGVLSNIASFAYYAETAERVVHALQAWPNDFHFYTLMPKSPAELFRFRNTIDLEQWLGFLEYYNKFQREVGKKGKGKWIRYFAYAEEDDDIWKSNYHYSSWRDLGDQFNGGYVKCEEGSDWKPQVLSENKLFELITKDIESRDQKKALEQNRSHDGQGTCVVTGCKFSAGGYQSSSWIKLEDAIMNLHVDKEQLRYRSMKEIEYIFDKDVMVEEQIKDKLTRKISSVRQRKIKFPQDIFAVRRASSDAEPEDWILLIGLDEHFIKAKDPEMRLAFSPVLDLCCMAESGEKNKETAHEVRQFLQKIFLSKVNKSILTHSEFVNEYIVKEDKK